MDPLTVGFENALHKANQAAEANVAGSEILAAALQRVIDASPHRARHPVTTAVTPTGMIELQRGKRACVLERRDARWRLVTEPDSSLSGPVASALTRWLTS